MIKNLYSMLLAICLLIPLAGLSQTVPSYAFQATSAAYDTVVQGTALSLVSDDSYAALQLPFDFKFAETTYLQGTNFYVCSNGYITIGNAATASTPSLTSTYSFISALGHDLKPGAEGKVSYAVTGTAPNQVLTIEWKQFQSYSGNNCYNFQIKLHETTNVIEFCYGPVTIASSKSAIVGLFDVDNSEKLIVRGSGSWSTFTASSTVTTNTASISSSSHPDSGLVYTFTPPIINCPRVSNLTASNFGPNSFDVTWHSEGSESSWILSYMPEGDSTSLVTLPVAETSYSLSSLTANTAYLVSVAADCGGGEQSQNRTITAYTLYTAPATMPYVCGFEDADENSNWTLVNDTAVNAWHIGNATYVGTDGNSLYISNDNGVTNAYDNSEPGVVYAVRDIAMDTNYRYYALTLDYKGIGESSNDYLKVWFSKTSHTQVVANTTGTVASIAGANYLTVGGSQYLNRKEDWNHVNLILDRTDGWGDNGLMRLYLMWRNNATNGSNPPIAIDNITLKGFTCAMPVNLATIDSMTTTSTVTVTWNRGADTDSEWQVCIGPTGSNPDLLNPMTVTDTTALLDQLEASTAYTIFIRTVCGTETSAWTSVSCRTACATYMTIPYAENFDSYGTGSSAFPSCWSRLYTTTSSIGYPYISSTTPYSGTGCLYFYSTSSAYSCAIAPQIDTNTNPINTLMVNFRVKKSSTTNGYGALQLGVMSDPTDISTFQTIKTWTGAEWETTNTWYEVEEHLSDFTGYGSYLALRKPGTISGYTYVDNFTVSLMPTCLKPLDVEVSRISNNQATINWTPQGTETDWQIAVVSVGGDPDAATPVSANSHPYTLTDLVPNTSYDVYVKASCGDEESIWSNVVSFQTRCTPTAVIPFVENFDQCGTGSNAYPECWDKFTNSTATTRYPYVNSVSDSGNVGALYFYATSAIYSLATSPAIDITEHEANALMLRFKAMKTSAAYGRLDVGVMTDPADLNTLTVLKTIYPSDYAEVSEWQTFYVPFTQTFDTVYLAFYAPEASSSYVYVDNVRLDYTPTCFGPSNLTVSNIAGRSAMLKWKAALQGVSDYLIEYTEAGQDNWQTANSAVAGTSYFMTGLAPQTTYNVRVSSNCTEGTADTATVLFTTGCLSATETTVNNGTQSSYNGLPFNNFYKYNYTQQIYDSVELGGAMAISSIEFEYAYSSPLSAKTNVTVYLAHTSKSTFASGSDWIPIDSATAVYTGPMNFQQGWNRVLLTTPFQYNGVDNLALIVDDNSESYNGSSYTFKTHATTDNKAIYNRTDGSNINPASPGSGTLVAKRNNVKFVACNEATTCVAPNVIVTAVDSNAVTLEWAAGNTESAWQIEYKLSTDTAWTSEGTVTASPYTIENLVPDAEYSIRMRSDCGSETSDYSVVTANTPCSYITTLPYTENFNGAAGSGAAYFIPCWYRGTNSTISYPYIYSTQSNSAPYSLYFYGSSSNYSYAAAPRIGNDIEMNNLQVSFYVRATSANYFIEVGIMTDPTDVSTFETIGRFSPEQLSTWELGEVSTDEYTGNGRYIAFRVPQWISNYIYLDDVTIQEIPFCGRVEDIAAENITTTSATITWTPGGNETEWEICYGLSGTVDLATATPVQVSADSIAISELIASSSYDVYVRIVCAGGDYGAWTLYTFRTACGQIETLPFTENFDTYASGSANFPECWYRFSNNSTSTNYPYVYGTYYYSGNRSIYFYAGTSTYNVAILPELSDNLQMNTLRLSFQMRSASLNAKLIVGVVSDPADVTTFVPIDTMAVTAVNTWQLMRAPLDSYTGTAKYVALKTYHTTSAGICVDDVELDVIPDCAAPQDLAVTTTATTADITWTDDPSQSAWELVYVTDGQTPDFENPIAVTSTSYSLTGLQGNSAYRAYIRTNCAGMPGSSDWESIGFVTPSENPAAVPYFTDFTDTTENSNWGFQNGTVANKWYIGQPTEENKAKLFVSNTGTSSTYTINSVSVSWAYRDVNFGNYPGYELSFDWKCKGESNYDYFRVYVGDPATVSAGNVLATYDVAPQGATMVAQKLNQQTTTQHFTCMLDGTNANQVRRIYFVWRNDGSGGTTPPAVIDSISIVPVTCPDPSGLTVSNATASSVDIAWTENGTATAWNIEYGPQGFTQGTGTTVTATTNPFTVTGLSIAQYDFYVQANCGAGDVSGWTGPVTATPGSYNFPTSGTTTLTICDGIIYDDGGADANYSSNCDATVVINPATAGNVVKVEGIGNYATESTYDYLTIYDGADNTGTQLFTTSGTSAGTIPACTSTTGSLTLYFHSDGSTVKAGFALQVSCEAAPEPQPVDTCHAPVLTVSNVDVNSATLSWTQEGTPDSWTLYYRKGTDAWTTVNITAASPYLLADLMPESNYEAYMVANCDTAESENSNTVNFTTLPDGIADYVLSQTKLYPNPTSSSVTIVNDNCMIEKVEVYDVYGQTLRVQQVNGSSVMLPADELAAGMYFVRIITDKGTVVKPFTKR